MVVVWFLWRGAAPAQLSHVLGGVSVGVVSYHKATLSLQLWVTCKVDIGGGVGNDDPFWLFFGGSGMRGSCSITQLWV